ncbi:MAG: multidrug ABC transporter ATP-binding protein, partial [Epulopiscium sp. Nuni2H_MBin003]
MTKILKNLTTKEIGLIFIIFIFTCLQIYFELRLPDYMQEITMLVQVPGSQMDSIIDAGILMLGCAFASLILLILVALLSARVAANFSFSIRSKIFNKVMSFSMNEINHFSTSSLITRTTNDITQVQMFIVMGTQMIIKSPLMAAYAIYKISGKNFAWTIATAVAVFILMVIVFICLRLAIPSFKRLQEYTDKINLVAREHLDGLSVVRAYNAEEYQSNKFEVANKQLTQANLFTGKVMSLLMPSIQIVNNGLVLAVYLIGAVLINEAMGIEKLILFSDMVVFSSYAIQVIMSFMMLVMVFMLAPRASISAKRINEVLETDLSIIYGTTTDETSSKTGEIEFRNVSFKYPDAKEYVLKDISFSAKPGEVVAFIGSTGCGKSTLVNLIPRFYDVSSGEILLNGINIKEYSKTTLNHLIGYVSQKAILFTGTVNSNVTYGSAVDNNALINSLDISQASEFVNNLDKKSDAYVAQDGRNLSGGQKQRLSIARAIYKNPPFFIFDDSFSALDYKTDRVLRTALNMVCKNSTRLIVGQRIGTIRDADK